MPKSARIPDLEQIADDLFEIEAFHGATYEKGQPGEYFRRTPGRMVNRRPHSVQLLELNIANSHVFSPGPFQIGRQE